MGSEDEDENEAGDGGEDGQRVKRHAEGARQFRTAAAESEQAEVLEQELKQDADNDEQSDDLAEREEAEERSGESEGDERTVGEAVPWVEAIEGAEEVAVAGSGPGDTGVTEEQGKDAGEGAPEDECGEDAGGSGTEGGAGQVGDEGDAARGVGTGQRGGVKRGQEREVHGEVKCGDDGKRNQDGAGDGALRIADLGAEEADVVVAPVVVAGDERGLSESRDKSQRGPAEKRGKSGCGMKPGRDDGSRGNDTDDGDKDSEEEDPCDAGDGAKVAVKQCGDEQAGGGGDKAGAMEGDGTERNGEAEDRPEPGGEGGDAETSGGDGKRSGEAELPDVEE